jgi:membrane protein implicated in regulation of membrane protease activity
VLKYNGRETKGVIMGLLTLFAKKNKQEKEFNPDNIVGKKCVVIEKIDNFAGCGQVKVNGQYWSARGAYDDDCYNEGEILKIVAVEGVRLVCVKNQ